MTGSRIYLCIDCGGSKTAAAVADSSRAIVARGFAGPSNYNDVGQGAFVQAIRTSTIDALKSLRSTTESDPQPSGQFHAVWVGGSGIDRLQDILDLGPILSKLFSIPQGPRLRITNDTHLLASPLAGFPEADSAIVVIAGTGSNVTAFRKAEDGSLREFGRIGGWGWILGDEGSGFHVGKETLRRILSSSDQSSLSRSEETTPTQAGSALQEIILSHFGITAPYDLFSVVYAPDPLASSIPVPSSSPAYFALERKHRVASLAPLVFKAAFERNDPDAVAILRVTSGELANHIQAVMGAKMIPSRTVLCFGGSLVGAPGYRQMIVDNLRERGLEFAGNAFVGDASASGAQSLPGLFVND